MPLDALQGLVSQLPALKAEYTRLGQLIAAIEAYSGGGEGEGGVSDGGTGGDSFSPAPRGNASGPVTVGSAEFVGMSTSEAIRLFLQMAGKNRPQGPQEIAKAMVTGGREHDAQKAYINVASALKRMKKSGEVVQVRRGEWGLASLYGIAPKRAQGPRKRPGENGDE